MGNNWIALSSPPISPNKDCTEAPVANKFWIVQGWNYGQFSGHCLNIIINVMSQIWGWHWMLFWDFSLSESSKKVSQSSQHICTILVGGDGTWRASSWTTGMDCATHGKLDCDVVPISKWRGNSIIIKGSRFEILNRLLLNICVQLHMGSMSLWSFLIHYNGMCQEECWLWFGHYVASQNPAVLQQPLVW